MMSFFQYGLHDVIAAVSGC